MLHHFTYEGALPDSRASHEHELYGSEARRCMVCADSRGRRPQAWLRGAAAPLGESQVEGVSREWQEGHILGAGSSSKQCMSDLP